MQTIEDDTLKALVCRALDAVPRAYAPYSHFQVGAAVLAGSGRIYDGVNVENASYPAGICAERNAIAHAIGSGERHVLAIAVCGGRDGDVSGDCFPCGICRQVMREFCNPEECLVLVVRSAESYRTFTLADLLPQSFGPDAPGLRSLD